MNFYLRIIFSSLFITFSVLHAQEYGKITGKVKDSKTSAGLEAKVKLFSSADNSFVSGTKCDSSGSFTIEKLNAGTYKIEISHFEYSILTVENIKLN